jgi:hypothetical protein
MMASALLPKSSAVCAQAGEEEIKKKGWWKF